MSNNNVLTLQQLGTMAKNCARKEQAFAFHINAMDPEELGDMLIELSECGLAWLDYREKFVPGSREWKNITSIIDGLLHVGVKTCVVLR